MIPSTESYAGCGLRATILEGEEDLQWLREVHIPDLPLDAGCALLYGNEDDPKHVDVYVGDGRYYWVETRPMASFHRETE